MGLLCQTAAKALLAPTEATARRLLAEYGLDEGSGLLESLATLRATLAEFDIQCDPPIGFGGLDDSRVLVALNVNPVELVLKEIAKGETTDIEFKSSLLLDWRRFREEPGEPLANYKLEAVTRSALKTIAAFANSGGGTLYIGVEDNTDVCGLIEDFELANKDRKDYDGWDQAFRGLIESTFFDGRVISTYVRATLFEHEGKPFVQARVGARSSVTFMKKSGGGAELYMRSGTRSVPIEFQSVEQHYEMRRMT